MGRKGDRYQDAKDKRPSGGFVPLPHIVIRSGQFARLSPHAVKLLIDLLSQYRGNNNGDLCATWNLMKVRGWRSRETLGKALKELIEGGWICLTKQGGLHAPNLYGCTIFALDSSPKLEVSEKSFPRGAWSRAQEKRDAQHAQRVISSCNDTAGVSIANAATSN